jgi:heptosyltransferase-1
MRILLVKLSSLGDVIHNLPVASDIARARPDIDIAWLTEAPYAPLVALHPAVKLVLPLHLRQLKKRWWSPAAWARLREDRARIAQGHYDLVLDTQGLMKSAHVAAWARAPVAGHSGRFAREPRAARAYQHTYDVPRDLHAVVRNRQLAAQALGYDVTGEADYGLDVPATSLTWTCPSRFVVFLHATSRPNKRWPDDHWITLGQSLAQDGLDVVLPWGLPSEQQTSERLAARIPGAIVPPAMSLTEAASMLARAHGVIGVDTGLAHLAVALKRPTVGLYLTTSPALTGLFGGPHALNLGEGTPTAPSLPRIADVQAALRQLAVIPA